MAIDLKIGTRGTREEFEDTYKIKMDTTTTYSIVVSDISVGS